MSKHTVQGVFAAGSLVGGQGPHRGEVGRGGFSEALTAEDTARGAPVDGALPAEVRGCCQKPRQGEQRPEDVVDMRLRGGQGSVWAVGSCWGGGGLNTALPIVLGT